MKNTDLGFSQGKNSGLGLDLGGFEYTIDFHFTPAQNDSHDTEVEDDDKRNDVHLNGTRSFIFHSKKSNSLLEFYS